MCQSLTGNVALTSGVDFGEDIYAVELELKVNGLTGDHGVFFAGGRFRDLFSGPRWEVLAAKGGRVQRPLWASTRTKNPAYSDVLYLEELIGPDTVNTVPPRTLSAFLDHGRAARTIEDDPGGARARRARLAELGIDLGAVCAALLEEGLAAFESAFRSLMAAIEQKAATEEKRKS